MAGFHAEQPHRVVALNDVVVAQLPGFGAARLRIEVGGEPLLALTGDGVVVASPTGSTAYTVGAGGPAVAPSLDAIVLTPLASQGSPLRSLVLDATSVSRSGPGSRSGSSSSACGPVRDTSALRSRAES